MPSGCTAIPYISDDGSVVLWYILSCGTDPKVLAYNVFTADVMEQVHEYSVNGMIR